MNFKEWLKYAAKHRTGERQLMPLLRLHNGVELSVQASEFHMCEPKEKLTDGNYKSVEVYTRGKHVVGFGFFEEKSPFTYGYIEINTMEEICKIHGGIDMIIDINGSESYLGADIRRWCKENKEEDPAARNIFVNYYSKRAQFKPNNKVYYFVEYTSAKESFKDCGGLKNEGYKLVRDLEKSPRKDKI